MKRNPIDFFVHLEPTFKTRESVQDFIEQVRRTLCAYCGSRCDCKYGADKIGKTRDESGNGCPEMRVLGAIFKVMTNREFQRFLERLGQ